MREYLKELNVGRKSPNFKALSSEGPIDFHHWSKSKWSILLLAPCQFINEDNPYFMAETKLGLKKLDLQVIALTQSFENSEYWGGSQTKTRIPISFPVIYDVNNMIQQKFDHGFDTNSDEELNRIYILDTNSTVRQIITFKKNIKIDINDLIMVVNSLKTTSCHHLMKT